MPHSHFRLFDLPPELRLAIYTQCTALALLQLAHTSSPLHSEINANPAIFNTLWGYRKNYSLPNPTFRRYRIHPMPEELQEAHWKMFAYLSADKPKREVIRSPGLSILDIEKVHPDELGLLERLYGVGGGGDERHKEGRRVVCTHCWNIVQEYRAEYFDDDGAEPDVVLWERNCLCYDCGVHAGFAERWGYWPELPEVPEGGPEGGVLVEGEAEEGVLLKLKRRLIVVETDFSDGIGCWI
ncbi:hypothetical protein BJ508DRAFT_416593 [Ascobolus immersus RN42]|uniref:F-box domain-containing protein n=1 Tax=Ascobolus immersus RN42 TaxID=1160509 RepID=A0A3N4I8V9_ASCIM|nr:hypothetical protein BJ508DRAFT_416593 [Ascobolus immersus RN42]